MARDTSSTDQHWWHERTPSVAVFLVVLSVIGLLTVAVARQVADVLPEVGRDQLGDDAWVSPLGINITNGFQVARVPDCAAGAFTRIALWDADSEPYWEVAGPATPLTTFVIGVAPEGFTEVVKYRDPPAGAVLRLVAFRRDGGAVGIRYFRSKLRENRVVAGHPLQQFTVTGFQTADVCGDQPSKGGTSGRSTTSAPGDTGGSVGSDGTATTTTVPG